MSPNHIDPGMHVELLRGPIADPAISFLLDKKWLALIKIRQLEVEIQQAQQYIETLNMQKEMLQKQYGG